MQPHTHQSVNFRPLLGNSWVEPHAVAQDWIPHLLVPSAIGDSMGGQGQGPLLKKVFKNLEGKL